MNRNRLPLTGVEIAHCYQVKSGAIHFLLESVPFEIMVDPDRFFQFLTEKKRGGPIRTWLSIPANRALAASRIAAFAQVMEARELALECKRQAKALRAFAKETLTKIYKP
jgi:hypothetical protein